MTEQPRERPPWWPDNEPFPPRQGGRAAQRTMIRRAIGFVVLLLLVTVGCVSALWLTIFSLSGEHGEMAMGRSIIIAPISRFVVAGVAVLVVFGVFRLVVEARRWVRPMGDIARAAARLERGDYRARATEGGARESRRLARAFNAMAERLESNAEQRRQLLADVTHELRTPLTILQGQLEGQLDGVYARDDAHLETALEQTRVMARLIEDLRTLSLSEAGALQLERQSVEAGELLSDCVAAFAGQAAQAGITLSASAQVDIQPLDVDGVRIRQVLDNLVANALRYTPQGGSITLHASRGGDGEAQLSVSDTGPGIAPERLARIFDRFYKDDTSRGSGLGLAIAKGLVDAHGGRISASSAPGLGTTMTISLPLAR